MLDRDNPFEEFLTDTIYVLRPDGTLLGPLKAQVDKNKIHLHDTSYPLSSADKIIRHLPNGAKETFEILDAHFSQGFYDIPATYEVTVENEGSRSREKTLSMIRIHAEGPFSRVNYQSEDNSINVQNDGELFRKIEASIQQHVSEDKEKAVLLESLKALQEKTERSERTSAYGRFVQAAANYVTILGPFLPALLEAARLNT